MKITDDMITAACAATILGEDEEGNPVHLEPREARTALTAAFRSAADTPAPPPPQSHLEGNLWDQLVVLSGYHITRPPTPDQEFVQVCNGDLRRMVELMGEPVPQKKTAGRWRVFEDTTPGYWGIELEDAGNDDDAIMYPIKIHRETVARIVEAHNAALTSATEDGR